MTEIGADQYVWDDADRLASFTDADNSANNTTFGYFPASWQRAKRVKQQTPPLTRLFAWDGADLQGLYDQNGVTMWRFETPGLDNHLSGFTNGNTYYFMQDAQGSIRNVADSGQNTRSTYDYRAYGEVLGTYSQTVQSPFRYTGTLYENWHSMQYYMRNRTYMPSVGLFSSRDAMWADAARGWAYMHNNPAIGIDPSGLIVVVIGYGGTPEQNEAAAAQGVGTVNSILSGLNSGVLSGDAAIGAQHMQSLVNDPNNVYTFYVPVNASGVSPSALENPKNNPKAKDAAKDYGSPGPNAAKRVVPRTDGDPTPCVDDALNIKKNPGNAYVPPTGANADKSKERQKNPKDPKNPQANLYPENTLPYLVREFFHEGWHCWEYQNGGKRASEKRIDDAATKFMTEYFGVH